MQKTNPLSEALHYARALRLPIVAEQAEDLADKGRAEDWSYEEYLSALLGHQASVREAKSNTIRIRRAGFPKTATLEDFNWAYQPSAPRQIIEHLATSTFIGKAENVVFLGPPGVGKTHLAIAIGRTACLRNYSVLFKTAIDWVAELSEAHATGMLPAKLQELNKYQLIIIDELGYLPLDADAANLMFQLVSHRYETGSIIVTSNLEFGRWGEPLADPTVAAAMIDRLVHHCEIIPLKGDSYRLKNRMKQNLTK